MLYSGRSLKSQEKTAHCYVGITIPSQVAWDGWFPEVNAMDTAGNISTSVVSKLKTTAAPKSFPGPTST